MIKIVFCLRRLPGLSTHEFHKYWYEVHAPLVKRHQKVLRIARYVQFRTEHDSITVKLTAFRGSPEPFDGVAEIWYETREALETLGKDRDARAASQELKKDEMRFVDTTRSPIWTGHERVIIAAAV